MGSRLIAANYCNKKRKAKDSVINNKTGTAATGTAATEKTAPQ